MAIDNLKNALPEYAKDLKLNLSSLTRSKELSEQQLWGSMLAAAAATRNARCSRKSVRRQLGTFLRRL